MVIVVILMGIDRGHCNTHSESDIQSQFFPLVLETTATLLCLEVYQD